MSYADSAWSCVGNDIPKFSKDFLELCAKNYCFVLKIFLWSHVPRLVGVFVLLFLLFLTFSALVANPKKLLYTVANPARGLLNREKEKKEKEKKKITRRIHILSRRYASRRYAGRWSRSVSHPFKDSYDSSARSMGVAYYMESSVRFRCPMDSAVVPPSAIANNSLPFRGQRPPLTLTLGQ